MKIAFDPQIFSLEAYGGISRYICSLVNALSLHPDVEAKIFASLHVNAFLQELPPELVFGQRIHKIPKTARLLRAVSQILARPAMSRFRPDIVHDTYYYSSAAYALPSARRVVTVYDMIHERFPGSFLKRDRSSERKRVVTQRADHVICISESTRRDLLELFDLPEDRVSVTYLGFNQLAPLADSIPIPKQLSSGKPYLLYVGKRGGYKNFDIFLRAYASSPWLRANFRVVCFGGGAFGGSEADLFAELGVAMEHVSQVGGGDDKLAACYCNAEAFICPSLYEGFGIPLLEAMSLDCPVICSNTSSIPEVAGDAAGYFDPMSVESIRFAIEYVLHSPARQAELIQKGRARCGLFTWDRCANETLAIYRSLV